MAFAPVKMLRSTLKTKITRKTLAPGQTFRLAPTDPSSANGSPIPAGRPFTLGPVAGRSATLFFSGAVGPWEGEFDEHQPVNVPIQVINTSTGSVVTTDNVVVTLWDDVGATALYRQAKVVLGEAERMERGLNLLVRQLRDFIGKDAFSGSDGHGPIGERSASPEPRAPQRSPKRKRGRR